MITVTKEVLEQINKFTRRELTEEEVYCFEVILCDNEIDRDNEKFSVESLDRLAKLYVGRTGIFNHDPKGENQTARIFDTAVVSDSTRKTADGEDYTYLRAEAYMVRTDKNADLIKEIDGGIKKEVSVGCAVERQLCSVCGRDMKKKPCSHLKGQTYSGKRCFYILDTPTDAYEWSFVAVPAQKGAGVIKRYSEDSDKRTTGEYLSIEAHLINELRDDLQEEIIRLSYLEGDSVPVTLTKSAIKRMDISELIALKKALASEASGEEVSELITALEPKNTITTNDYFKV